MMSKALKSSGRFKDKEEPKTKLGKFLAKIAYHFKMAIYYPVDSFISRYIERIGRSLSFAKRGWLHYDFESAYLYDIMAFKLKRIYPVLKNGHAIQNKEDMDALLEAIKICERLFAGNYDDKYHRLHDKKWGKLRTKDVPSRFDEKGNPTHYSWLTSRKGAKTKKQKEAERKAFLQTWADGEKDRIADLDRLNEILKKHEPAWWD